MSDENFGPAMRTAMKSNPSPKGMQALFDRIDELEKQLATARKRVTQIERAAVRLPPIDRCHNCMADAIRANTGGLCAGCWILGVNGWKTVRDD